MKASCPQLGPAHPTSRQFTHCLLCTPLQAQADSVYVALGWGGVHGAWHGVRGPWSKNRRRHSAATKRARKAWHGRQHSGCWKGVVAGTLTPFCCAVLVPDDHCTSAGPGIPAGPPAATRGAAQGLAASTVITDCTVGSSLGEQLQRHLVLPWPLWCNHNSADAAAPWVVHHPRYCVP